ncbi:MAG: TOBE domain-containing protein [Ottowia sp.]|nr:LysR family transcriptional regulator [Ottowia sp.]
MSQRPVSAHALGYSRADKRLEILRRVGEEGSISQAARSAGVSYKAAWQAIHTLTNLAGEPLVDSSVGGAGGGGARLTPAGERLLQAARQLARAREQVFARMDGSSSPALAHPRTSMRNALRARVLRLESAGARDPMVRVVLTLPGGAALAALITRESAELLDLSAGLELLALCKATAVRIDAAAATAIGTNRVAGSVLRVARGHARDEVMLTLDDGQQLVGFAATPNRLRRGLRAQALVDEKAVVLGVG